MLLSGHDGSDANETNANEKRASMCPPRCENRRCETKAFGRYRQGRYFADTAASQ